MIVVWYSLQMEKWMVKVMISFTILCGGSHEGSLLSLWVLLEGFIWFGFVGRLLTVL
jgi:hypothetical protein